MARPVALASLLILATTCNAGPGILLPPPPPAGTTQDNVVHCDCGISFTPLACDLASANGIGNLCDTNPRYFSLDVCLPPSLAALDQEAFDAAVVRFCNDEVGSAIIAAVGMVTNNQACSGSLFTAACQPGSYADTDHSTGIAPTCGSACGEVLCTTENCKPSSVWSNNTLNLNACACTKIDGCSLSVGPVCRP